jgi:anti-sigma regulatory factor (Ser/Thr protein kinase)
MSILTIDAPAYALEIRRADTTSPTRARRWLAWVLEAASIAQDTVEACVLAVSELVTNSALHAGGRVLVSAEVVEAGVRLVVHDSGTEVWSATAAEELPEHGRGLLIVEAVASDLDIASDAFGTTVTALIPTAA